MKLNEPAYWEGESEIGEECHDVEKLTNNKYFFIYSHACYAGAFDNEMIVYNLPYDCIGEYLTVKTEHGAFACILNSCFGYYNIFTTYGASQRYNREFWDAVFDENITIISRANQDSKEDNIWRINGGNGIMRIVYYELNLLGDPSVQFKYLDDSLVNSQSSPQSQPQTQPNSEPSTQPSSQPSEQLCDTTQQSTTGSTTTSK